MEQLKDDKLATNWAGIIQILKMKVSQLSWLYSYFYLLFVATLDNLQGPNNHMPITLYH